MKTLIICCIFSGFISTTQALTIKEAVKNSLENNKQILAQYKQVDIARERIAESKSSYYPRLSIGADYTYYDKNRDIFLPDGDSALMGLKNNYLFDFTVNQLLFDWGKRSNQVKLKRNNYLIELEKLRNLENQIIFNIKEYFYRIDYLKNNIYAHKFSLETAKEDLKVAKLKYKDGKISEYEVLRAEVEVVNSKPTLVWLENALKIAYRELEILIGTTFESTSINSDLDYKFPEITEDTILKKALQYNSSIQLIDLEKKTLQYRLKIESTSNKPKIEGFYSFEYLNPLTNVDEWDEINVVGVKASIPFFDGFKTSSRKRQNTLSLEKNTIEKEDLEDTVAKQVEEAYLDFTQAKILVEAQNANVKLAQSGLKIAKIRFKDGLSIQVELLDAKNALLHAQVSLNHSKYKCALSYFKLQFLTGELAREEI